MAPQESPAEQYERYLGQIGKSTNTVKAYCRDLIVFTCWFEQTTGDEFNPQAVTSQDIQDYRSYLSRQALAPSTINRRLKALRNFFRWARRAELVTDSPFEVLENVFLKEQKNIAPRWLNRKEQLALLRAVREKGRKRDMAIVQTFLGTGLRISELAALEVRDLDISERKGSLRVRAGKGNKAREIPLDNTTRQALSEYLEERAGENSCQLFLGQRGPINKKGIDYLVNKYAYQAQLENCTAHTLRHTYAKNLVNAGTPLDQVATLLGHESLDTTRIYTRPSRQDLEKAVRRAAGEI